jgi:hypothetical protein
MKSIMTLLTVVVLLGLTLTSTSCKKCSKDEPINGGDDTDNTPSLDTTTSSSTIDDNSKAPDDPTPSGDSATDDNSKAPDDPTPSGDSVTGSDDKKGGGSGATDKTKGGIPIPSGEIDKVPVTLDDKRKAVEKLVRDVEAEFRAMGTLCDEALRESRAVGNIMILEERSGGVDNRGMDNIIQARNKMEDATAAWARVQAKADEVKAKAKELHIDGDIVAIALVAKADEYVVYAKSHLMCAQWQVEMAALRCSERVKSWVDASGRDRTGLLYLRLLV